MKEKDIDRFHLSYVFLDGCWIWIRNKVTGGYGGFNVKGQNRRAHRVSYELAYGVALTPDQFLHHTRKNKDCVNPEHLEIVSQLTHMDSAIYGNKEKTHCPYGHEYTPRQYPLEQRWKKPRVLSVQTAPSAEAVSSQN